MDDLPAVSIPNVILITMLIIFNPTILGNLVASGSP